MKNRCRQNYKWVNKVTSSLWLSPKGAFFRYNPLICKTIHIMLCCYKNNAIMKLKEKLINFDLRDSTNSRNDKNQPPVRVNLYGFRVFLSQERRCPIWIKSKSENSLQVAEKNKV